MEKLSIFKLRNELYRLAMPGKKRDQLSKVKHQLKVFVPHEQVNREISNTPTMRASLESAIRNHELPPNYYDHPIVRRCMADGQLALPLSLYIDGVPYSHTDSVIGWWIINEITQQRHLICVLRKSICCNCGCRSWCSFKAVFLFLLWPFQAMPDQEFPSRRHDGESWTSFDEHRAPFSGNRLEDDGVGDLKMFDHGGRALVVVAD